jgi:hypothetical protein
MFLVSLVLLALVRLCTLLSKVLNLPIITVSRSVPLFILMKLLSGVMGKKYNKPWLTICRIKHSLSVDELFQQNNSILLLDEAGLELFARNWKNRTRLELDALFRIRHYGNKLLYVAQHFEDVDIKFRNHTQLICWIRGFQLPTDPPRLVSRFAVFFDKHKFGIFLENESNQAKIIFPLKLSGFRFKFDWIRWRVRYQDLFNIYDSFDCDRSRFIDNIDFVGKQPMVFIDGNAVDWSSRSPRVIPFYKKGDRILDHDVI